MQMQTGTLQPRNLRTPRATSVCWTVPLIPAQRPGPSVASRRNACPQPLHRYTGAPRAQAAAWQQLRDAIRRLPGPLHRLGDPRQCPPATLAPLPGACRGGGARGRPRRQPRPPGQGRPAGSWRPAAQRRGACTARGRSGAGGGCRSVGAGSVGSAVAGGSAEPQPGKRGGWAGTLGSVRTCEGQQPPANAACQAAVAPWLVHIMAIHLSTLPHPQPPPSASPPPRWCCARWPTASWR